MSQAQYPSSGIRRTVDDDIEAAGIHPAVYPHEDRIVDPINALRVLQSSFESLPRTSSALKLSDVRGEFDAPNNSTVAKVLQILSEFIGSWSVSSDTATSSKLINPNYIHLGHLEDSILVLDDSRRLELLRRYAGYGIVDLSEIAPRFGLSTSGIESVVERHDFPWTKLRREGRKQMARTWVAITRKDYSWSDISLAFGVPKSTMKTWADRYNIDYMPSTIP